MQKFLPIFPLNLVAFPNQPLNLHIFEARYKQLINDSVTNNKTFGLPAVIKNNIQEYGTEMRVLSIEKKYEDGAMDIKTIGVGVFRILEVLREVPDKEYSAAIVSELPLPQTFDVDTLHPKLLGLLNELHAQLGTNFNPFDKFKNPLSYELAPYVAMPIKDQVHMLSIVSEKQRQRFMRLHLERVLPTIEASKKVQEKISMNGHFRNEIPPTF